MAVNADKTNIWKADIAQSVDMYNDWFVNFAPKVYRETRRRTTEDVENALKWTTNLTNIEPMLLRQFPEILPMLRMTTAPPIARDRLVGLARVSKNLVENMEIDKRLPPKMSSVLIEAELKKIGQIIVRLADRDLFPWLEDNHLPSEKELYRAATIVADRLCGAATDPIIRNAQEQRQLKAISGWLNQRGYKQVSGGNDSSVSDMQLGTYSFRRNVPVTMENERIVKIPLILLLCL